ncbi:MAG: proline--tRNA ligase [Planctomycetota bacterium]
MSKGITPRNQDYSRWYNDIVQKAELADYAPVKGCMVIRPYGFAIWENIHKQLDARIKESGAQNAYFPMLIPESYLQKEAEHVEGFAPECAVVTHGGGKKLEEPLVLRPTSETIICAMFSKWIHSWRDLPMMVNQWANIVRWEMRPRLFLSTTEFLWQEGHTCHATREDALEEALKMLEIYREFAEEQLAMPVLTGTKSLSEKFAGADITYPIETMTQDRRALQAGTSHLLGQNFAKAFDIKFQDKDGELKYVWQTSWGVSTRLIGGIVMVHSDDNGLVLPPQVAPIKTVIIPIVKKDTDTTRLMTFCENLKNSMCAGDRVLLDSRDQYTPGWKFNEWEQKGVPVRIEIGPREVDSNTVVICRRDTFEKKPMPLEGIEEYVEELHVEIQANLLERAKKFLEENTFDAETYERFKEIIGDKGGFARGSWCGQPECEELAKAETMATIRVLPFDQPETHRPCVICGKPGKALAVFAKAY